GDSVERFSLTALTHHGAQPPLMLVDGGRCPPDTAAEPVAAAAAGNGLGLGNGIGLGIGLGIGNGNGHGSEDVINGGQPLGGRVPSYLPGIAVKPASTGVDP